MSEKNESEKEKSIKVTIENPVRPVVHELRHVDGVSLELFVNGESIGLITFHDIYDKIRKHVPDEDMRRELKKQCKVCKKVIKNV